MFMLPNEVCLLEDTDDPFVCRVNLERLDRLEYLIAATSRAWGTKTKEGAGCRALPVGR